MRKTFDKKSGAIIYSHTPDELKQAEAIRDANKTKKSMKALCKILNISEEDLEAAMSSLEETEEEEG